MVSQAYLTGKGGGRSREEFEEEKGEESRRIPIRQSVALDDERERERQSKDWLNN